MQGNDTLVERQQRRAITEAMQDDCLSEYNPMTREDYESTIASWIGTLLVLADHVASHPQPDQASGEAHQEQQPEPKTRPFEQDLAV